MAREKEREKGRFDSWRIWAAAFGWLALFVSTAVASRKVEHFVSTDPQFRFSLERRDAIAIEGLRYATRSAVTHIFAPDNGRSIYLMPLAERRRRLLAIDWIEDATVSRLWPNRVLVRITERRPVAFVNVPVPEKPRTSRLALIDSEGVFLEPPDKTKFNFPILQGVFEQQSDADRRLRVTAMQQLLEDLGPLGKDISEINALNTEDMCVILQIDGRALELELGDSGFAKRVQHFINHYAEVKRKSPAVTSFNLRLENTIITKE
jgi:cell division protein FtsQ